MTTFEHDPESLTVIMMPTEQVAKRLQHVCTRLYSERRMDGEMMRDTAQYLQAILDSIVPED